MQWRVQKRYRKGGYEGGLSGNVTHTHPFNDHFSGTTRVSRYQKGKPIWILLKQETVSSSGISWAICKSAPRSRQLTMPAPHYSGFSRPDALPAAQQTASKHWRPKNTTYTWSLNLDRRLGISIIKMQSDKFVFLFHKQTVLQKNRSERYREKD